MCLSVCLFVVFVRLCVCVCFIICAYTHNVLICMDFVSSHNDAYLHVLVCITQDILSGVELNKMVSLVEVMIENHTELFEVPQQVQVPAKEYLKKKRSGEVIILLHILCVCMHMHVCVYINWIIINHTMLVSFDC